MLLCSRCVVYSVLVLRHASLFKVCGTYSVLVLRYASLFKVWCAGSIDCADNGYE